MHLCNFPEAQPAEPSATHSTLDVIARTIFDLFYHRPAARARIYVLTTGRRHFQSHTSFFATFRSIVPGAFASVAEVGPAAFPSAHESIVGAVGGVFQDVGEGAIGSAASSYIRLEGKVSS